MGLFDNLKNAAKKRAAQKKAAKSEVAQSEVDQNDRAIAKAAAKAGEKALGAESENPIAISAEGFLGADKEDKNPKLEPLSTPVESPTNNIDPNDISVAQLALDGKGEKVPITQFSPSTTGYLERLPRPPLITSKPLKLASPKGKINPAKFIGPTNKPRGRGKRPETPERIRDAKKQGSKIQRSIR